MRTSPASLLVVFGLILAGLASPRPVPAHPGSGIAVDHDGQVYFVHTGVGVFRIAREGRLLRHAEPGFHFMILDRKRRFTDQQWPPFPDGEIHVSDTNPQLLLSSSFPLAIGPDGALYYPEAASDGHVHIMRLVPSQAPVSFARLPHAKEIDPDGNTIVAQWIHGLAAGHDGALYYTEKHAVRRIAPDGSVSLIAGDVTVADCVRPPAAADERLGPVLRGLDVARDGTLYAAASGCSAVLKITPAGDVSVVLRGADAWSPTGVAVAGDDVYVLEFCHIQVERAEEWLPRVRRLSPDGVVTVLAAVEHPPR